MNLPTIRCDICNLVIVYPRRGYHAESHFRTDSWYVDPEYIGKKHPSWMTVREVRLLQTMNWHGLKPKIAKRKIGNATGKKGTTGS